MGKSRKVKRAEWMCFVLCLSIIILDEHEMLSVDVCDILSLCFTFCQIF